MSSISAHSQTSCFTVYYILPVSFKTNYSPEVSTAKLVWNDSSTKKQLKK